MTSPADHFRRPLGLALSGGGALNSWQTAALAALEKAGLRFDAVLGFSAGALNATYYCLDLMDEALERWKRAHVGTLKLRPRLFPPSLFSDRPVWDAVACAHDDATARARARCRLVVVSAARARDRLFYARYSPDGREGWDAPLARHLLASCAIPFVFPSVQLDFRGERVAAFDGGVPCAEPMSFASLGPCRDVIVLEIVRPEEAVTPPWGPLARLDFRARRTMQRLIGQGVQSLRDADADCRVFRLPPSRVLKHQMLHFHDKRRIAEGLELGAADAQRFLAAPEGYLSR